MIAPGGLVRFGGKVGIVQQAMLRQIVQRLRHLFESRGKSYNKWLGSKPPCHRDQLRMAIDAALAQKPVDLDTLFQLLRDALMMCVFSTAISAMRCSAALILADNS